MGQSHEICTMNKRAVPRSELVWQLKVTLKGTRPPIWRRFMVAEHTTFGQLHQVLQIGMGWFNSHLHAFALPGLEPDFDDDTGDQQKKKERLSLRDSGLTEGSRFIYEYDFGDGWRHEVTVEKIVPATPGTQYPICVAGKRACPPEDCGGVFGYARNLEILNDPLHKNHAEIREWMGDFDPEEFRLELVNARLAGVTK
jgi:hypothetical protein